MFAILLNRRSFVLPIAHNHTIRSLSIVILDITLTTQVVLTSFQSKGYNDVFVLIKEVFGANARSGYDRPAIQMARINARSCSR